MVLGKSLRYRLLVYPIIIGLFFLVCAYIVSIAFGYDVSLVNGKLNIKKTGLVIVATRPGGATIFLDGKKQRDQTSNIPFFSVKVDRIPPGKHHMKITKEGYETWEAYFEIEPERVCWANYVILVPQKREAKNFNFPSNVSGVIAANDKSKELVHISSGENKTYAFWEINTGSKEKKKLYEERYIEEESFKLVSYSYDTQRFLIEKRAGDKISYLVFEAKENPKIWDITDLFKINTELLAFNPRNHGELFVVKDKTLFSLDYQTQKQSAAIDINIIGIYPDINAGLLFVKITEGNYGLWRLEQNGSKTNIVKNLEPSDSYQIKYVKEYESYAVLPHKAKDLFLFKDRGDGTTSLKRIGRNINWFFVSPKSKYLGFSQGSDIVCYDFEKEKYYTTLKDRKISSITWFNDDSNLLYIENGKLYLVNYDGFYDKFLFDVYDKIPVFSGESTINFYFARENEQKILDIAVYDFG